MALFTVLLLDCVVLVGAVILIGYLLLLFRNPYRARWLRNETVETAAALVVVTASLLVFAALISGLSRTGLSLFAMFAIAVTALVVVAVLAASLFRFRERLERADAGQNPFGSMDERVEKQPAIRMQQGY